MQRRGVVGDGGNVTWCFQEYFVEHVLGVPISQGSRSFDAALVSRKLRALLPAVAFSIRQGDIYWIDLGEPSGSEPAYVRPYVVIQNDVLNSSRIRTVIVCALISNLRRAAALGNVLLEPGEANLPEQSVVNVSQVFTVDKALLTEKIGMLSLHRVRQILAGLALITEPQEAELISDEEN